MKLKTTLLGKTYTFRDIKQVLAKANEEKTGDQLAGLAAETAQERVAAKVVLSALTLSDLREHPAVPYESDEVTRIIQDDVNETVYARIRGWTVARPAGMDSGRNHHGQRHPQAQPGADGGDDRGGVPS